MKLENAKEIAKLTNKLEQVENKLNSLTLGHKDELYIGYRGNKRFDLDGDAYNVLVNYYEEERSRLTHELEKF